MKHSFIIILLLPLICSSQQNLLNAEGSLMIGHGSYLKQKNVAGTVAVNVKPFENISVGAGLNLVTFKQLPQSSPALYGEVRGYLKENLPFLSLAEGKVLYNASSFEGVTTTFPKKGKTYFSAGAGYSIDVKSVVKPFILLRYSSYNFEFNDNSTGVYKVTPVSYGFISVNLGLQF